MSNAGIAIYANGHPSIWVPVSKRSPSNEARAFIPFDGLNGRYTYGFKAQPEAGNYLEAIAAIQKAWIEDRSKVFILKDGSEESQKSAKWRHSSKSSPLLGPTVGWVEVPIKEIESVTAEQLTLALEQDPRANSKKLVSSTRTTQARCNPTGDLFRPMTLETRTFQAAFRTNAIGQWSTKCALSGATRLLEAAHLKSVATCKKEDLAALTDPLNSIILNIALHALLDDGLIAFSDTGALLISSSLSPADRKVYGVDKSMTVRFDPQALKYVKHHRTTTFIG